MEASNPPTNPVATTPAPGGVGAVSPRPLGAWKRITGRKAGEGEGVWLVEADIYTSPTDRTNEVIVLRNPPTAEEAEFYRLQGLLAQYDGQITNDQRLHKTYEVAAKQAAAEARAGAQGEKWERVNAVGYQQRAAQEQAAAAAAAADEQQAAAARAMAQRQLDALPGDAGPVSVGLFRAGSGTEPRRPAYI